MTPPDFISIGHVTLDRFGSAVRPGGAALYAAVTAHRLGLSVGLLTSHADDFPLDLLPPQIEVVTVPAPDTTRFEHRVSDDTRVMAVTAQARALGAGDVPSDWSDAALVLLAPVVDEVDPLAASVFPEAAIGAAAQGWLRRLNADGVVEPRPWAPPEFLLQRVQSLVLSIEDARDQQDEIVEWFQRVPFGVLTAGKAGALLFVSGERYEVRPFPVAEVDATGAGDVFAATFLIEYHRGGDPWDAAALATCAAALSVTGDGWTAIPDRRALDAALAEYRARE